ncbi:MAG: FAD-binding oxidoreductase [Patescibacteria group bacterium]
MIQNNSPWLQQLKRTRPAATLLDDIETDIAIVGGGIAGVATAYYLIKNTKKNIVLVEADRIAHGATGHNAGQLASYFERPFSELVGEFGLELAADGQRAIESAWTLLDEIFAEARLRTPMWQFTGYAASRDIEEILVHLKNNAYRLKAGLNPELIMIAEESSEVTKIPSMYQALYTLVPQKDILALLESRDVRHIAALPIRKGCMNSALFSEEVIGYLLAQYANRFMLAEHAPVERLVLYKDVALLEVCGDVKITARNVILCTNGFEKIKILNTLGSDIDTKFHHLVRGAVGYMAGYLEEFDKSPIAISYLPELQKTGDAFQSQPYFYLTRRPYEGESHERHNLVCVGGPESLMDDTNGYSKSHPYSDEAQEQIDQFLHTTYAHAPTSKIDYKFRWHGLMGYTPTGVRCIGPEPSNPVLYYNLGCNGVGLLHSIYGGKRISRYMAGEHVEPSIFDPKDRLQETKF